jgi:hypothetical protein
MGGGIVKKFHDQRVALQRLLHDASLDSAPAPVNQPDFAEPFRVCLAKVLVNNRWDVSRRKCMEVERLFDGNTERIFQFSCPYPAAGFSYRAVTSVLMPPRTEKSPTTVIRRGRHAPTRSSRI